MAIQDDFTINPKTKVIRHDAAKSTVYTAVAFYSFLQDTFDEPGFLSYEIPIRFNTPTSFTMLNGWFLDDGDGSNILQYITAGGIDTLGYSTISDPVLMIDLDTQVAAFVAGDLDLTITIGTAVGPLLSFKETYPSSGLARIWVRDTNTHGSVVPGEIVTSAGTGAYSSADYSQSGDNIYHNLFTIAAFPGSPSPQLYVYQNHPVSGTRTRIAESSAFTNWDRGSIDILVTTKLSGTLIDGGNISTFVRQTGDTFTFVESTLTTSGRTPIATETAADTVNITVGEHYMFYNGGTAPTFTVGNVITNVAIGVLNTDIAPPSWYAEIVAHTAWTTGGGTSTGFITLRGLRGTPVNADNIFTGDPDAADPVSIVDSTANVNGQVGDTLLDYTGGVDPSTLGQIMTQAVSGTKRILRAFDTTEEILLLQDDPTTPTGANRNPYYLGFDTTNTVSGASDGSGIIPDTATTTLISGFNDVTVSHMNGTVTVGAITGTFTEGERVTWSGGEAIFITGTSSPIFLGNVQAPDTLNGNIVTGDISGATTTPSANLTDDNTQNFEFSLQNTGALYSVFIEGGSIYQAGRSLTDIYAYLQYYLRDGQNVSSRTIYTSNNVSITALAAEEYIKAASGYNATKVAPFGSLAGGVFFGAQAVWLQGMRSADNNNIKLTDSLGALQQPFTAINVTVSNTRLGDRVAIFLENGTTELPLKTQYISDNALNTLGISTFNRNTGAFPNDTPTFGTFVVVDNTLKKQHRYRYISRNGTTNPGIFTLPTQLAATSDGSTASEILEDVNENFSATVQVGDIIHRTNGSLGYAYVTSVASAASGILGTTLIEDTSGTAAKAWSPGDTYAIHSLVKAYNVSDTFFVPYMDEIETVGTDGSPGSITVALTYVADREIILEVRNVEAVTEIIPFKTTGQITITGYTQGVIRNEDTVTT